MKILRSYLCYRRKPRQSRQCIFYIARVWLLTKDLFLYMTHEKTSIAGPKLAAHSNLSDLNTVLPIERESIQDEN